MFVFDGVQLLAYLLILLGLAGTVLPMVPGPLLIWLGALVWSLSNGLDFKDWVLLIVLGVLALLAWCSDLLLTMLFSRRQGISWKAVGASTVGGLLGGLFLSDLPVVGTLFGAMIGAVAAMSLVELLDKRSVRTAFATVRTHLLTMLLSSALEIVVALVMVAVFVWRAVT